MEALVEQLFGYMDGWRHLPAYKLEPRADLFFALYLPEILKAKFGCELTAIIPEFPLRVGTICSKAPDINKSFKVDYVCKLSGQANVLFVELKTDQSSRREKQDWYLAEASKRGFHRLLEGVLQIYEATEYKQKYEALLQYLKQLEFLTTEAGTWKINGAAPDSIEVLYVQPYSDGHQSVGFAEIACVLEGRTDILSRRFASSLREWSSIRPGKRQCF